MLDFIINTELGRILAYTAAAYILIPICVWIEKRIDTDTKKAGVQNDRY